MLAFRLPILPSLPNMPGPTREESHQKRNPKPGNGKQSPSTSMRTSNRRVPWVGGGGGGSPFRALNGIQLQVRGCSKRKKPLSSNF